ncbi:hypothetical protein VIBNIFTn2_120118 [Vibrio nigripulchritudo FTn2]|uniref:hypothetical protein n=1 Tax=Vibrio nigripulchritudo TaxID=28173 RepID=UPI0003B1D60C|nr:hypothetical protein [Vibrio nigripulchritudo]CCN40136.1 hypothetical protein VIBNIFTn2_120118 [Vibrio nigripulchritudo FTn2]
MEGESSPQIPIEYWISSENKWDSHNAFRTTNHWHVSFYGDGDAPSCDLMIVECDNGKRFFIKDNWGSDAKGHPEVFNPFDFTSYPQFFTSFDAVNHRTAEIVAAITGAEVSTLLIES